MGMSEREDFEKWISEYLDVDMEDFVRCRFTDEDGEDGYCGLERKGHTEESDNLASIGLLAWKAARTQALASGEVEPAAFVLRYEDEGGVPMRDTFYDESRAISHYQHNTEKRGLSCELTKLFAHPPAKVPVSEDSRPLGAAHNGRVLLERVEYEYSFECEAGPLERCTEWHDLRRCFNALADYVEHQPAQPGSVPDYWLIHQNTGLITVTHNKGEAGYAKSLGQFVDAVAVLTTPTTTTTPEAYPCWCCDELVSLVERSDCDGDCPHCGVELDPEDWPHHRSSEHE